jgi:hypothetical protein
VYNQKKMFSPHLLSKRTNSESLKCQLRKSGYDMEKALNIEVRNNFVWTVFDNPKQKCADHILMMANIEESDSTITATLEIPGGKRRLGELTVKGAVRETYEETFVKIKDEDLELIYGTETDLIYRVVV